jgi:hypothetical protein
MTMKILSSEVWLYVFWYIIPEFQTNMLQHLYLQSSLHIILIQRIDQLRKFNNTDSSLLYAYGLDACASWCVEERIFSTSHVPVIWRDAIMFTRFSTASFVSRFFILREPRVTFIYRNAAVWSCCVVFYARYAAADLASARTSQRTLFRASSQIFEAVQLRTLDYYVPSLHVIA